MCTVLHGCPHRVLRVATAAFWRTFHYEGKISPGWCGWGCTPIPFHYIYHHQYSCSVCSSWVGRHTYPVSSLVKICTLWLSPSQNRNPFSKRLFFRVFVSILRRFSLWKVYQQGITKRCCLSWQTNSALVYEPKYGGRGELRGFSQRVQLCTRAQKTLEI